MDEWERARVEKEIMKMGKKAAEENLSSDVMQWELISFHVKREFHLITNEREKSRHK